MATIRTSESKALRGKDLITIGIFSAIYFIINFIIMISSGLSPVVWILMPGIIALLTGVPFMIMVSKVQKTGAVFVMGIITGLLYFLTGQFTLVILITFVVSCLIAEIIRFVTNYRSYLGNMLAFVFFSLGMIGSPLPIWLFRDSFFAQIKEQGMSADYVANLEAVSSTGMLIVLIVAPIIGAIIGGIITKVLFNKHFQKAGIV
ncbi:MptD family putative ECF transporter S component [Vallitalea guaymasensis]|uniref:MptD family putative ECF transporter S component n=1 Tax=Vallitalea guaymasensis TaxID=1185412 RepID=UPI002354306D|nr:MptD family putative ECF transporter S component [Vallitalea guaymasensis]